jgi:hypothetical protein
MLAAHELPSVDVRRRRSHRRSPRSRMLRNLKQSWRRTKLRKVIISLVLTAAAVVGGYKASMYVVARGEVDFQQFNVGQ